MTETDPIYFGSATEFRKWLAKNHAKATELWVGYHRVSTGKPSMTWAESVDEALCYGWIDGIRRSVDGERYVIRFTPRKRTSQWSAVNVKRMAELEAAGRVKPTGRAAFEARQEKVGYSYEQRRDIKLDAAYEKRFRANKAAWLFFQAQPVSYRSTALFWIMSAKKEETRERRLTALIDESANARRLRQFNRPARPTT